MATQAAAPQTTTPILAEWLALLDKEGVSARNRDAHRMGVERFGEYMKPRTPDDASAADVRGFLAYLGELGVSEQSQGVYRQILDKWVAFAMTARRRNATAEAAANVLADAEAPAADSEDSTLVFEVEVTPDPPLTEAQADSTWPFAHPRPAATASGPLAAAFDAPATAEPPVAAVTIDFAEPAAFGEASFEAPSSPFGDGPGVPAWSDTVAAPEPEAPVASEPDVPAAPATAPTSGFDVSSPFDTPPASGFTFESAPPSSAPASSALGGFDDPPASLFSAPASGFGAGAGLGASAPPVPDADATPVKPLVAATATAFPAKRAVPERDAATGDHVMGDAGPSIALAVPAGAQRKGADAPARAAAAPAAELKASVQGWSLRVNGTERHDLDLTQIRNLVATGQITPHAMIRKPGGEWMKAGEYHPLRSVFQQAFLDASQGGPRPTARPVDPLAHPAAMAWLGAGLGAVAGAVAWWLVAVVAGSELLPMALLVAVLSGGLAAWLGRGESYTGIGASAVATLGAMIVGRAAVYQTLRSGVIGTSTETVDPFVFLAASATPASITWWGIAIVVAAAVGGVTALMRRP